MLLLGSKLANTPVMGLQTGTKLAEIRLPIIDPSNLAIVCYEVEGPLLSQKPLYLRIADVRELGNIGMIIDSNDEFIKPDDVISIKKIIDLNFNLIGLDVRDDTKHKLGKVYDFVVDTNSFIIQQLCIKKGIVKGMARPELLVHRSQILEINDSTIIVKSSRQKLETIDEPAKLTYMNPFRKVNPQTENST